MGVHIGKGTARPFCPGVHQHLHAKGRTDLGHSFPDAPVAENAQSLSGQLLHGVSEHSKHRVVHPLPRPGVCRIPVYGRGDQQNVGKDHLRHRFRGIARHIADRDPPLFCLLRVHIVVAGGKQPYIPEFGKGLLHRRRHRRLVAEDPLGIPIKRMGGKAQHLLFGLAVSAVPHRPELRQGRIIQILPACSLI